MEQDSELHVFIPTPDQLESCPKSPAKHYLSASYELKFTDLCVKIDKREILKDVYGVAKPGEMVAIMGPSGAGKTTLLNCLAGRRPIESGTLTLNSRSITKQLKRKISYVLQQDIFIEDLTCWETLWFTALLRLPGSMPRAEKKQRIMELVDALDMEKCLHTKIGNTDVRGLSGGEKKRTTIACELLTNPALMLLDEPTSGLDSSNAFSLCTTLKKFAKDSGKILIASIHQPSSQIFNMFDKLLLLCDGKMAYFGEVKNCAQHFASLELPCPANYNLADHILDQVKGAQDVRDTIVKGATQHRKDNWVNMNGEVPFNSEGPRTEASNGAAGQKKEISKLSSHVTEFDEMEIDDDYTKYRKEYESPWPTGFFLQFSVLFQRSVKYSFFRIYSKWHIMQFISLSIFIGMMWFQIEPTERQISNRQGVAFFFLVFTSFEFMLDSVLSAFNDRVVVNKERLAGYYRLSAYYLAKNLSEIPLLFGLASIFFTIIFWLSGLSPYFVDYLQMLGLLLLSAIVTHGVGGLAFTTFIDLSPSLASSSTTILVFMTAGGFFTTYMPFWIRWMKYVSFISHGFYANLNVQYSGTRIRCNSERSAYSSCQGISSASNSVNQSAFSPTNQSEVIKYISTEELLTTNTLAADGWTMYHHILVLIGYAVLLKTITYLLLRFVRKPHLS